MCMGPGSWPTQTTVFVFGWRKDTVAYSGNRIRAIFTPSLYQETQTELIPLCLVSTVVMYLYITHIRAHFAEGKSCVLSEVSGVASCCHHVSKIDCSNVLMMPQ
jgi:hypothetical protein